MTRKEKRELKQENKRRYKGINTFTGFLLGMYLVISAYLIYNLYKLTGIEDIIRYIIMGVLALIDLFILFKYFRMRHKPRLKKYIVLIVLLLIFGAGQFFIANSISKGLNLVDKISSKDQKIYKTSLVALKSGDIKKVSDIDKKTKIGRVNDKNDIENYQLSLPLIKEHKIKDDQIVDYDDPITMLYDLYEGEIDAAFISGGYVDIYKTMQKFEKIKSDLIELDKYSKKMKVKENKSIKASTKSPTEPFTLLLLGVDSEEEDISNASGLGDSIMVITFNPKTLNATIFSIPRDTFVKISCYNNVRSKITHAASGGDQCMINTIENFLDIDIDYYAKVNFQGLIKIVDSLGGIDVNVPYAFCESDENRTFNNTIFVEKGMQHLNGRQALALSRNRKTNDICGEKYNQGYRSDFVRGQNQQLVINAIINKAKSLNSINQFYSLLDAVGKSLVTNMNRDQILSFYNIFKKVLVYSNDLTSENNIIDMQKMYLNGSGALIQDGIMTSMNLYEYVPSTESLNAIIKAMKINLELIEDEPNLSFSFSADEEYEPEVIGSDLYGGVATYPTVEEKNVKNCGTNEELGADGVTCVCKSGYEKDGGTCKKKKAKTCEAPLELSADGTICQCPTWNGYEEIDGVCTLSNSSSTDDTNTTDDETGTGDNTPPTTPETPSTTPETPTTPETTE